MLKACQRGETIYTVDGLLLVEGRHEPDPLVPPLEEG